MSLHHPDPDLLDQLADVWDKKAAELETLRATFAPGQDSADVLALGSLSEDPLTSLPGVVGTPATEHLEWSGAAQSAAGRMLQQVSRQVANTAELARRWARRLRRMAEEIRERLAEEAKSFLVLLLSTVLGFIAGMILGFVLAPVIAAMAEAIVASIMAALEIASTVAATLLTITFEFTIGALAFAYLQWNVDVLVEVIASAATNTPFTLSQHEWVNIVVAALTGGLFSLSPAAVGLKNIPVKGDGAINPGQVKPAEVNLNDGVVTPGQIDSYNGTFGGTDEFGAAATRMIGGNGPVRPGSIGPKTISVNAADLRNIPLNLDAVPRPGAGVKVSESSSVKGDPVAGSPGTRNLRSTPEGTALPDNGAPLPLARTTPDGQGPPKNVPPGVVGESGRPPAGSTKPAAPPEPRDAPIQPAPNRDPSQAPTPPANSAPRTSNDGDVTPTNTPRRPGNEDDARPITSVRSEPPRVPDNLTADPNPGQPPMTIPNGSRDAVEQPRVNEPHGARSGSTESPTPSAPRGIESEPRVGQETGRHTPDSGSNPPVNTATTVPRTQVPHVPDGDAGALNHHAPPPGAAPETSVSSPRSGHTEGGSTGHPGLGSAAHAEVPPVAVPVRPDDVSSNLQAGLRERINTARGIDRAFPDLDRDFAAAMRDVGGQRTGLDDARAAALKSSFAERVSARFGEVMDRAFHEGRPPTAAERASWTDAYGKALDDLRTDIRVQGAITDVDAAVTRLVGRVGDDPVGPPSPGRLDVPGDALRSWTADANGLVRQAARTGDFRRLDDDLRALEGNFDGYVKAYAAADRAAEAAGKRFDAMLHQRNGIHADIDRIDAARAELVGDARNAYLARWGAKSMDHRAMPNLESLDRHAASWLREREGTIDARLTYLERIQGSKRGPMQDLMTSLRRDIGVGRLDWAAERFGLHPDGVGKHPMLVQAEKIADASAGSFAQNVRPQYSVAVRSIRTFVEQAPARIEFSNAARSLLDDARASFRFSARQGELTAVERGLTSFGAGDRGVAAAEGKLADALDAQITRVGKAGYKPSAVDEALEALRHRADLISDEVRRDTIDEAAMQTAVSSARKLIDAEVGGRGVHLGQGTLDRITGEFTEGVVHRFRQEHGASEGSRPQTRQRLSSHLDLDAAATVRDVGGQRAGVDDARAGELRAFDDPRTDARVQGAIADVDAAVRRLAGRFGDAPAGAPSGRLDVQGDALRSWTADAKGLVQQAARTGDFRRLGDELRTLEDSFHGYVTAHAGADRAADAAGRRFDAMVEQRTGIHADIDRIDAARAEFMGDARNAYLARWGADPVDRRAMPNLESLDRHAAGWLRDHEAFIGARLTDLERPLQVYRVELETPSLDPGAALSGSRKLDDLLGTVLRPEQFVVKGSEAHHLPIGESSNYRLDVAGATGRGAEPDPIHRPPAYDETDGILDLPVYDAQGRPPAYTAHFTETTPARDLVTPTSLDTPMDGVGREMAAIRQERRDGVAAEVESLERVGRPEVKGPDGAGTDPLPAKNPYGSLRDRAWNAMAKQEADLDATLGERLPPGGDSFAPARRPVEPARTGRDVAEDVARLARNDPRPGAETVDQHVGKLSDGELARANEWVTRNPESPARAAIQKEHAARFGPDAPRPEARTPDPAGAVRSEDLTRMRADVDARDASAQRLNGVLDQINEQQQAVRAGIHRQYVGVKVDPGEPMPSFPSIPERAAQLQRLGVEVTPEGLAADTRVAKAAGNLRDITAERSTIDSLRRPLDQAIDTAQKQAQVLAAKRFAQGAGAHDIENYDRAVRDALDLQTYREEGLASLRPRENPTHRDLVRAHRDEAPASAPPPSTIDPEHIGDQTLALMRELREAARRLDALPTPQPARGGETLREWLGAYDALHERWKSLSAWQQQGLEVRDRALAQFERTAILQHEQALLDASEPAVRGAQARASAAARDARNGLNEAIRAEQQAAAVGPASGTASSVEATANHRPRPRPEVARPEVARPEVARPEVAREQAARAEVAEKGEGPLVTPAPKPSIRRPSTPPESPSPPERPPPPAGTGPVDAAAARALEARWEALRAKPAQSEPATSGSTPVGPVDPVAVRALEARWEALRAKPAESEPPISGSTPVGPVDPVAVRALEARWEALRNKPLTPADTPDETVPRPPRPTVEDEPPVIHPASETVPPDIMRFSDPERVESWLSVRDQLIRRLFNRLAHASVVDRTLPNLESSFVRVWHDLPAGSRITERQLVEQFERFGTAAARALNETFADAFTDVRIPTGADRQRWQERYDDLLRDLADDLRQQVGRNEIEAVASAAFERWQAEDPEAIAYHNEALRHWTRDAETRLASFRNTRTWDYAPAALGSQIARLDVYRAIHRTAPIAAAQVAARFDEMVAERPRIQADPDRVARSRAEAVAAGHDRYVRWWTKRMDAAVGDLEGTTTTALSSFRVLDDAIDARLDYLDETQLVLDAMYRLTEPDALPRSPLTDGLSPDQMGNAVRIVQREAESLVDSRATPFVANVPRVDPSRFRAVSRAVMELRDQLPARAAFAARAALLTEEALTAVDAEAAKGAAEAVRHGLDPTEALSRVSGDVRREIRDLARDARERFAGRQYAQSALTGVLAVLEAQLGRAVGRVHAETVRDALLRAGDAEAVATLNQYASQIGSRFGRPVQERIYGDFEHRYVRRFHDAFGDGATVDVAAWLSRTRPDGSPRRALPDSHLQNRLLTAPDADPVEVEAIVDALALPGERGTSVERRESQIAMLPEEERAHWRARLADGRTADAELAARAVEVVTTRWANDAALTRLVSGARRLWNEAGAAGSRVSPSAFGDLVHRFYHRGSGALVAPDLPSVTHLAEPVPGPAELTEAALRRRLARLAGQPAEDHSDIEARWRRKAEEWFRDDARTLPHDLRERFWAEWLTARDDDEKRAEVRERMRAAVATELRAAGEPLPNPREPGVDEKPDAFAEAYAIVPRAERDRFREAIARAGTVEKLDRVYAELDARRDELAAEVEAARAKADADAAEARLTEQERDRKLLAAVNERLTDLKRYVPSHGYRILRDDVPAIRLEQAQAFDDELAEVRTPEQEIAWTERVAAAGYRRVAEDGMPVDTWPTVPMQDSDLSDMVWAWVRAVTDGTGVRPDEVTRAAEAMIGALDTRDGTALQGALSGLSVATMNARVAELKQAGPVRPAEDLTPAEDSRLDETGPEDLEADEFVVLLDGDSLTVPAHDPLTLQPRSVEDLVQRMPSVPEPAPSVGGHLRPGPSRDESQFDEEVRRMAEAEGRTGAVRGGIDVDAELLGRLERLREPAAPAEQPTPEQHPTPADQVTGPVPTTKPKEGIAEVEVIQSDGTVVRRTVSAAPPAVTATAALREQLAELDEIYARTEAAYVSYLELERDLRARNEDLDARFAAHLTVRPELAAGLDEATIARLKTDIADEAAKHFLAVRESLASRDDQLTMVAAFIAARVTVVEPIAPAPVAAEVTETSRVDELAGERFTRTVADFRRADLFGGRYLSEADQARLRASYLDFARAAAGTAGSEAEWVPTSDWAATLDTASARLIEDLSVVSSANRWFDRVVEAVVYDHGENERDNPRLPHQQWYRDRFQQRLLGDWTTVIRDQRPGRSASGVAYLGALSVVSTMVADEGPDGWPEALTAALHWIRVELDSAYRMGQVLAGAAQDFHRIALDTGADLAHTAAVADLFRADRLRDHLAVRGVDPDTYEDWLAGEKTDTDVFGVALARLSTVREQHPVAFGEKAERVTVGLLTEYRNRVATAGEVAQRMPDFAERFAAEVTASAARTDQVRDRVDEQDLDRFRTLDGLPRNELTIWRDRVVADLTDLYHRVWNYAVSVGAAVDSEHWQAASRRWDELAGQYWTGLRTQVMRQRQAGWVRAAVERLRAEGTRAGLPADGIDTAVADLTADASAAIERLLHSGPFDPARLGRWAELESDLLTAVPSYVSVARARAQVAERAATAYRETAGVDDRLAAEAEMAALEVFDRVYRQFRWADADQRLAQAEFAAGREQPEIIAQVIRRGRDATERLATPRRAGSTPLDALGRQVRRQLDAERRADPAEAAALRRVEAEIEALIAAGLRDNEAAVIEPALGGRAADRTTARVEEIMRRLPQRLADERRLADALTEAARRFDELPGAERLTVDAPLRVRFLSEAAGKIATGIAYLTSTAQKAAVGVAIRSAAATTSGTTGAPSTTAGTDGMGLVPSTLPPVEVTPMTPPRPAEQPATVQPEPRPDARQQYRDGFYERVGSTPPAEPGNPFGSDLAGERAELEWSLNTLAAYGTDWLDQGFRFLDEGSPEVRAQILVDAIRTAPAGALGAMSGLLRGVSAHPEWDMPVAYAARAVHLALTGRAEAGTGLIHRHWRLSYPPRQVVREALVARVAGSDEDRVALSVIGVALVTC
ncbi:hypothetical protein [Micromonospora sp. WMMD1155]|uniref:hypothetical protein n=1 Tax=Micromonospora sp. WMMD1155 TaxID=3016094 RepID=UPI00249A0096|nr:hypothetical protein [Micromonospora sp. WMMD1155]WFE48812.1 hypothetical protein O7617_00090 [Micromonospora sp. WMMD1155]